MNRPTFSRDPKGNIAPFIVAGLIAGLANAHFNRTNGKHWFLNFAIGAVVGAGGAYAVTLAAGLAGSNVGLAILYGAGAGAASSWSGQMIINESVDQSKINWMGVGFGAAGGAIGGGISAAGKGGYFTSPAAQDSVETIDAFNKGSAQAIIDAPEGHIPLPDKIVIPPPH